MSGIVVFVSIVIVMVMIVGASVLKGYNPSLTFFLSPIAIASILYIYERLDK